MTFCIPLCPWESLMNTQNPSYLYVHKVYKKTNSNEECKIQKETN